MKKILKINFFVAVFLGLILISGRVFAASNISVSWSDKPSAFFNAQNIAPGETFQKSMLITNNDSSSHQVAIKISNLNQDTNLAQYVNLSVFLTGQEVFQSDLNTLNSNSDESKIFQLNASSSKSADFVLGLDGSADNSMQNKTIGFDLTVGFVTGSGGFTSLSTLSSGSESSGSQDQQVAGNSTEDQKQVAGDETNKQAGVKDTNHFYWWYWLVFLALLGANYWLYLFLRRRGEKENEEKI